MDETINPTLEETLKYSQAKAILKAPCIIVAQIEPSIKTITEYEEKFNIPKEERFKSDYISQVNSQDSVPVLKLETLCNRQPTLEPLLAELVSDSKTVEDVECINNNEFVLDPINKKCYGIVPFFRLDDKVWKYFDCVDKGNNVRYINGLCKFETFNFHDEEFRNSLTPVIPKKWLEFPGYKRIPYSAKV